MGENYTRINITNDLKSKYNKYLRPEILSIFLYQTNDEVWLETYSETLVNEKGWVKETVNRINLDFITEDEETDEPMFNPKYSIETNARKFIDELSPYSLINTTDLFTDEAGDLISKRFNIFGIDR